MNAPAMVADHLDTRTDALIQSWRDRVHHDRDVTRSESLTYSEFLDHVPLLIDRIADRLRGKPTDISAAAEEHGHARFSQGYDMTEVVAELGHLRTALMESTFAFAREHHFDLSALESTHAAIHHVLNETTVESVRRFDEDSRAAASMAMREVEHRNQAIEKARLLAEQERAKLGILLDNLPVGVWVFDAEGKVIALNREGEQLQQFPASQAVGRMTLADLARVYKIRHPDGREYQPDDIPIVRALRGESVAQEEMTWHQPRSTKYISASAAPLRDASGRIFGAVVVAQDRTSKKQLEASLSAASAQLHAIVEQSPVMIWRTGVDGRDDFVNQTFRDFLGTVEDSGEGGSWFAAIHREDAAATLAEFREAFDRRAVFSRTFRVIGKDGQPRWIASRGVPYQDDAGKFLGYLGSCLDVTDQTELEAALGRQKQIAEEASQHKSRLMLALSHDARTPLNAVVLSAQLLEMHVQDEDDPEVQECLRTIRNGVKNVLDLLGDLLDLTRIDAGAMPAEFSQFSLEPTLSECVSSIEPQARLKGLDCRVELDGLAGLTLSTDRAKLKQILANFLSNALRYTDRGHVRLWGDRTPESIKIAVEDTGIGIAAADQARVFDEFATLENPRRPGGEGTGLGLAICRRLAGLLGGTITIDSEVGRGTTFTLVLPASVIAEAPANEAKVPAEVARPAGGAILVAEDHDDSRRTLVRLLKRMGYRALEAADGREVLEQCRAERPMAILMDVNMPGMNGIDATLALRSDPSLDGLPIFALTGDVSAENQRRIGEAGVDGYIQKPVTGDALKRALGSLESREA